VISDGQIHKIFSFRHGFRRFVIELNPKTETDKLQLQLLTPTGI